MSRFKDDTKVLFKVFVISGIIILILSAIIVTIALKE